ncbi:MAG: shikimate kinase [Acidobacteriota bacterium]|nr:shikimate kinase [Acidobacteriota bacterium]
MSQLPDDRPLFLVGFMGTGKTSVGEELARSRRIDLVDTDAVIEASEGRSIERIFADSGEDHFRRLECELLEKVASRKRIVVATGGGIFLARANRKLIRRAGPSVWLDVPLEVLRDRLGRGAGRPLWSPDNTVGLRAMFERRRAAYALADHRVDGSRGTPGEIAAEVSRRLAPRSPETRIRR